MLILVAIIILIIIGVKITITKVTADFTYLNQLLEKSSELTTAKLKIAEIESYKDASKACALEEQDGILFEILFLLQV